MSKNNSSNGESSQKESKKSNQTIYYRSDFGASFTPFAYVTINGEEIARKYAVDVKIDQTLCEHTVFELLIPSEAFRDSGTYPAQNSKELLGAKVAIELKQFGKTAFTCSGEVVQIGFQVKNKYPYVKLTGKSPTWKMDSGKQCQSFENQTLEQIVKTVTEPYTRNGLPIKIAPRTKDIFEYIVMSNESAFEFLRRLAIRFGEYFFWNGTLLVFGRAGINEVKLQEGRDFHEYNLNMQAKPQHFVYEAYDYRRAKTHSIDSRKASNGIPFNLANSFQRRTVFDSENLFPEAPASYTSDFSGEGEFALTNAVLRQKELRRNTAYLTAKTDNPRLRLGSVAKAEAWVREYLGFKNEHVAIEDYIVTQITHSYNSQGYCNTFTAVPLEQEIAPNMDESFFPRCEQQSAVVTDNNDPDGMSRIRVRFPWQKPEEQTPWLRVVTPYAGGGKGIHVIPEIEEEVMVIFEDGNAEKPLVLGALFNGKGKSGHKGEGNNTKAFQTKNTSRVVDDEKGSIIEKDKAESFWELEGDGKMHLKAKQITLDAEEDISLTASKNMILNVSDGLSVFTSHFRQMIKEVMKIFSEETLISSQEKLNFQAKDLNAAGTEKAFVHSDKETILNSKGKLHVKGSKKYDFGNRSDSYKKEDEEIMSSAIVEFRTKKDYKGEFGFDWLRMEDNGLNTEQPYEGIIEGGYGDGETYDFDKEGAYEKLTTEYDSIPVRSSYSQKYHMSYLSLFSKEYVEEYVQSPDGKNLSKEDQPKYEAELRVLVDVDKDIDKLEFEYDEKIFELDKKELNDTKGTGGLKESKDKTVKITCLKDFDREQEINLYAYPKDSSKEDQAEQKRLRILAGKIKVLPNDKTYRKNLKFVLVEVTTNAISLPIVGIETGTFTNKEIKNLYNTLHQALIVPTIEKDSLDLSTNAKFQLKFINENRQVEEDKDGFFSELKHLFLAQEDNSTKYRDYFTAFALGIDTHDSATGQVDEIGEKNLAVFPERSSETFSHESLHGLGLYHTHRDYDDVIDNSEQKYIYPKGKMDNIMSYSTERRSTWKWQWKIINPS